MLIYSLFFIRTEFKKPQRYSNLCDYCEYKTKLQKDIITQMKVYDFVNSDEFSTTEIDNFLNEKLPEYENAEDSKKNFFFTKFDKNKIC